MVQLEHAARVAITHARWRIGQRDALGTLAALADACAWLREATIRRWSATRETE